MDPVTIAGLALAIVPLIISAVENYEAVFQPFVVYRQYSREITKFTTRLDAQKAIFNNQCQLLLLAAETSGLQEDVLLDNILKDPTHPSRKNQELSQHLGELLGQSAKTCTSTLHLIHQTLGEIARETKGFQDLLKKPSGEKTRFGHLKSRIKISFSKTRLNGIVTELRSYNDDLRVLSDQVSAVSLQRNLKQPSFRPVLIDLRSTHEASERLHDLLMTRWVCSNQVDHAADLSLDVQTIKLSQHERTRLSLSVKCVPKDSMSMTEAIWLIVEPRGDENSVPQISDMDNLKATIKNLKLAAGAPEITPAPALALIAGSSSGLPPTAALPPAVERLCSYFHSEAHQVDKPESSDVYFETTNKTSHYVYKGSSPSGFTNRTLSLKQVLQEDADRRARQAWISKFKLARLLTLGVLRFQSTPWLTETLSSGDVHFLIHEYEGGLVKHSIEEPFIRTQFCRDTSSHRLTDKGKARQLAPNELLHNLGVILLELGYDAPLHYLRSPEDIKDGDTEASWYTDFFTARRLGKSAPRDLDARYGRLIKKCLDCDFGVGDDLGSAELQSAILRDVVIELDRCIQIDMHINSF